MDKYFEWFIRERKFEKNITPKTVLSHEQAWASFKRSGPLKGVEDLTKDRILQWLEDLHETGIRATSINCYSRSLNAFFKWLFDNKHISEPLKIKRQAVPVEVIKILPDESLRAIINYRPTTFVEKRIHAMSVMILDTGIRINEALTLMMSNLDLDNERLKVVGKGRKERIVPFSFGLCKILTRYLESKELKRLPKERYLFCTRRGVMLNYDNTRKDYDNLCSKLNLTKTGGFHRLRHTFATNFLKSGGNLMYLKDILGHTDVRVTQVYVHSDIDTLREAHQKCSIFGKFKK